VVPECQALRELRLAHDVIIPNQKRNQQSQSENKIFNRETINCEANQNMAVRSSAASTAAKKLQEQ
jgi:hypothetical protein